jgi:hypothetical protein
MKRIYFYLAGLFFLCFSCTEKEIVPISESSGKPEQIEILDTVTIPGGVIVNYKIPPVNDIIEIKAIYTLSNGQVRESSSSFYTSSMTVVGYNDTDEHEAEIYTINRAREMSDPVKFKFHPGESSLSKVTKSMQITSDFGGVNFSWRNPDKASLIFEFYTENDQGEMVTMDIIPYKTDSTNISYRGYDHTKSYKFAVNIRDNYGNSSGIIYPEGGVIIPMEERILDKNIQRAMTIEGDVSWDNWEGRLLHLIDNNVLTITHTNNNTVPGASFTLDIGKKAKLSRFVLHQRQDRIGYLYASGNFQIFEVYSSDEEGDSPSGNWSDWKLQIVCTISKISGAEYDVTTSEDIEAGERGHDFSLPLDMPPVRYLRFKVLKIWDAGQSFAHAGELTTYGIYAE